MNIKFVDSKIFEQLMSIPDIIKIEFGSNIYGIKNENSDTDIMIIYPDKFDYCSVFKNHHQFQYKDVENNIDYIFTSVSNFIRNLVSGDSTIAFEIVYSGSLKDTSLNYLHIIGKEFITYKILRSYLGMCRRDLTDYHKQKSDRDKNKAILHGIRGYLYCKELIETNDIKSFEIKNLQHIFHLTESERKKYSIEYQNLVKDLRDELNLKKDGFVNYLKIDVQELIDKEINKGWFDFFPKELKTMVYKSNEEGITY